MPNEIILLIAGLIGLTVGAIITVDSARSLAHRLGVSQLLIGLTIVSIGTSLPEIMVTVFSGMKGASGVAIGSMVGSCLTQVTLILGIAGIIHNIHVKKKTIKIDGMMLLIAIVLFWVVLFTGHQMTRIEAGLLILIYFGYLIFTARHEHLSEQAHEFGEHEHKGFPPALRALFLFIGLGFLVGSGHLVLENAVLIAQNNGLSEAFIGIMVIGVATCLPELSTAIMGAARGAPGIAIGTLIGSNITDPLFSTGVGGLVNGFEVQNGFLFFDIPVWFFGSVLALLLLHRGKLTLNRYEAAVLVVVFVGFAFVKITFGL